MTDTQQPAKGPNKLTATAPERIYLLVSDDPDHYDQPFPRDTGDDLTWCEDAALDCYVEYVRADAAPQSEATDTVDFYEREFYPLSNFSAFNLRWGGSTYQTSEHAYQAMKFDTHAPELARAVWCAPSAHEAFKIAERHRDARRPDWDAIKVQTMRHILIAKADQHEYVRRKLLETGDRQLIECSWRDDFWGWGPNRDGQNMLGKLWMEIRAAMQGNTDKT